MKRCLPTNLVNKGKYIVSAHGTCYGIHVGEHVAVSLENEDAAMLGSEEMTMLLADASKIFYQIVPLLESTVTPFKRGGWTPPWNLEARYGESHDTMAD